MMNRTFQEEGEKDEYVCKMLDGLKKKAPKQNARNLIKRIGKSDILQLLQKRKYKKSFPIKEKDTQGRQIYLDHRC